MEEECSLILDIMGDKSEVPRPEVSTTSSLSEASSGGGSSDTTDAEAEGIGAMDPRKSARSYDFGTSIITVSRIR
jgi:hypothetical protein